MFPLYRLDAAGISGAGNTVGPSPAARRVAQIGKVNLRDWQWDGGEVLGIGAGGSGAPALSPWVCRAASAARPGYCRECLRVLPRSVTGPAGRLAIAGRAC